MLNQTRSEDKAPRPTAAGVTAVSGWIEKDPGPIRVLIRNAADLPDRENLEALGRILNGSDLDPFDAREALEQAGETAAAAWLGELIGWACDQEAAAEQEESKPAGFPSSILASLPADPQPGDLEPALREFRAAMVETDPIRREIERGTAVGLLKVKGLPGAARLVDAALKGLEGKQEKDGQGQTVSFEKLEAWETQVDGAGLLNALRDLLRKYVVLTEGAPEAEALWALFTYVYDSFECNPRLAFSSATKRCGKSRNLDILGMVVCHPLPTSNVTAAALFRCVESWQPTVLIDEADSFLRDNEDLRGILNSGWTRSGAWVMRVEGEAREPRMFSTWAPVCVALIGNLPGTLEDRAIKITMKRKAPGDQVARLRRRQLAEELKDWRRQAIRWAEDHKAELEAAEPESIPELDDRAADNWGPMFAIADLVGGSWPVRAREVARLLSADRDEAADTKGVQALSDLRDLFDQRGVKRLTSQEIVTHFEGLEESPWKDYRRGKALTQRQLAYLLRPFGIRSTNLRMPDGGVAKGYERTACEDAFRRYLPPGKPVSWEFTPSDPLQALHKETTTTYDVSDPLQKSTCSGSKSNVNPLWDNDVALVADQNPQTGGMETIDPEDGSIPEPGWEG